MRRDRTIFVLGLAGAAALALGACHPKNTAPANTAETPPATTTEAPATAPAPTSNPPAGAETPPATSAPPAGNTTSQPPAQ